jgi:hypothetical protein
LKRTRNEGLLTELEYAQARTKVVSDIASNNQLQAVRPGEAFGPEWMHDELAYLARMKKDGILTDAECETARKAVVEVFVPPNSGYLLSGR